MATNYPGSLDAFVNPASGNTLDSPSHSLQHSDINDAVEAIETKLGVGSATPGTATAYFPLVAGTAGATSWTRLTAAGITSGTATAGQLLRADGSGAAAWATPSSGGLVLLNTTSFSAVSSQPINTVFSATYDCYKIVLTLTASSGAPAITFRIRSGTTDKTAADYYFGGFNNAIGGATLGQYRGNASTSWGLGDISSAQAARYFTIMDIANPFTATATKGSWQGIYANASDFWAYGVGAMIADSTSYDGFNILASTGTITGKVVTYGYNL